MSEAELATETEKGIKGIVPNAHISFVESHLTSAGFPDMDIFANGHSAKLELKFSRGKKLPHMRASQVKWFRHRARAGGIDSWIFALVLIDGIWNYLLIPGLLAERVARVKTLSEWRSHAVYHWEESVVWEHFVDFICPPNYAHSQLNT